MNWITKSYPETQCNPYGASWGGANPTGTLGTGCLAIPLPPVFNWDMICGPAIEAGAVFVAQ